MPLLRKTPFRRVEAPKDLQADDLVFVCEPTKEAFRCYEEFFKRTILCNSLVWSCSLTGKSGLTFEEAQECEKKAKNRLGVLLKELKLGLLWSAHHTRRGRLSDLVDDVYKFSVGRYFHGEKIEAVIGDLWCESVIREVIPPTEEARAAYIRENAPSTGEDKDKKKKPGFEPHESLFKYQVLETDPDDPQNNPVVMLDADDVRREKYSFTRDKILLFLKKATEFGSDGNFKLKKTILEKYNVPDIKFSDVFGGPLPVFEETKRLKAHSSTSALNRKTKQSSMDQFVKGEAKPKKTPAQIAADLKKMQEQNERFKQEMRQRAEDAKKRKMEEKAKEKERKKEAKKLVTELMAQASKPREDLTCDDHRELPQPKPVHCRVPNHLFGDFLMLLEFYKGFSEVLETNDTFPFGVTFNILESALCTNDSISTDLTDLLAFTLKALFDLQKEEEEEVKLNRSVFVSSDIIDKTILGKNEDVANQIRSATDISQWPRKTQGTDLWDIHMDKWSITEILRIHLESAGAYYGDKLGLWRFQQRGGYRLADDPGMSFRMDQPQILDDLSKNTVFELSIQDKLRILTCLADQILSFATVRDEIDERFNMLTEAKTELRHHNLVENRRLKQVEESKKARSKEEKLKKESCPQPSNSSVEVRTRQRNSLQAQKEKEDKIRTEREEILKYEASEKERELFKRMSELYSKATLTCLGRDRSYRRFWVLKTVPGIFVENDDEFLGPCLPEPTPYNPNAEPLTETRALEQAKEILNAREKQQQQGSPSACSDKENKIENSSSSVLKSSTPTHSRKNQQKILGAKNGGTPENNSLENGSTPNGSDSTITAGSGGNSTNEENGDSIVKEEQPWGLCLADNENCPVHSTVFPKTRWSFYSTSEELESLIGALNPRGFREKDLLERLQREKVRLKKSLDNFDLSPAASKLIQSDLNTSSQANEGDCIEKLVDLTFRDQLLDLEEKIFFGTLGTLKVASRGKWLTAIQSGNYDQQCDSLKWSGSNCRDAALNSLSSSRAQSPNNGFGEEEESSSSTTAAAAALESSKKIKGLSSAILQIGQMVDEKYLKEPLSESEKERKKRLKEEKKKEESEENCEDSSDKLTPMQHWERSLMNCTSYAQLFIHMTTLESSIIWSKSTRNASCRICRRKSDPEKMLLCDGCDRGHHMKCLKPPLKAVPEGDWFCNECKPKERIRSPKKKRRVFMTNEEDENNDSSDNEEVQENQSDGSDEEESAGEEEDVNDEYPESGDEMDQEEPAEMDEDMEDEEPEEIVEKDSPRQKKAKKKQRSGKGSPEVSSLPLSKKRSTITQLLGKRRCATEANEKIHQTAQESSSGNSSGTESAYESRSRGRSKRNLESFLSTDNLKTCTNELSKKRGRKDPNAEEYSPTDMEDLLNSMMKHQDGWPFDRPITKNDAPDYHKIIKKPMDLGTIRSNLNRMKYQSNEAVFQDIKLVFDNCFCYNRETAEEYECGVRLEHFFNKELEKLGLSLSSSADSEEKRPSKRGRRSL